MLHHERRRRRQERHVHHDIARRYHRYHRNRMDRGCQVVQAMVAASPQRVGCAHKAIVGVIETLSAEGTVFSSPSHGRCDRGTDILGGRKHVWLISRSARCRRSTQGARSAETGGSRAAWRIRRAILRRRSGWDGSGIHPSNSGKIWVRSFPPRWNKGKRGFLLFRKPAGE